MLTPNRNLQLFFFMKHLLSILLLALSLTTSLAQLKQPPKPLKFREGNIHELDLIVGRGGVTLTPSNSLTIIAEVRQSDQGRILYSIPMANVDTSAGTLRGFLPNMPWGQYYLGLYLKYAGEPSFRAGITQIQVVPAGSLDAVSDATGLNIQISQTAQVLSVQLDATPSSAIASYYAQRVRDAVDSVNTAVAGAITLTSSVSANVALTLQYKNQAGTSASNAATSEANAQTYKANAQASATSANNSATAAGTSASNAATSEANALTYKANALASANNAATSESNALTYKNNAQSSATSAATSAGAASASAAAAATSASQASASAVASATSAAQASASAAAAATSAANAQTANAGAQTAYANSLTTVANCVISNTAVSTSYTIDMATCPNMRVFLTLTGNTTLTINNASQGRSLYLKVIQGGAGSFTMTFPAACIFPAGASIDWNTTAGKANIFSLEAASSTVIDTTYYKQ